MRNSIKMVAAAFTLALLTSGCSRVFTSINRNDDGSYTLTRTTQGAFYASGHVYRCTEENEGLSCEQLNP